MGLVTRLSNRERHDRHNYLGEVTASTLASRFRINPGKLDRLVDSLVRDHSESCTPSYTPTEPNRLASMSALDCLVFY